MLYQKHIENGYMKCMYDFFHRMIFHYESMLKARSMKPVSSIHPFEYLVQETLGLPGL